MTMEQNKTILLIQKLGYLPELAHERNAYHLGNARIIYEITAAMRDTYERESWGEALLNVMFDSDLTPSQKHATLIDRALEILLTNDELAAIWLDENAPDFVLEYTHGLEIELKRAEFKTYGG